MSACSRLGFWLLGATLTLGCSDRSAPASSGEAKRYEPLVELDAWTGVARADDPFVNDAEPPPACLGPAFRVEADQGWLELDTSACSFITVSASASYAVELGQPLKVKLSHYDLDAPTEAEARIELWFGGCRAWSEVVPIPSDADVREEELASPCTLHENDAVLLHLENHGQNTYQLQGLWVLR